MEHRATDTAETTVAKIWPGLEGVAFAETRLSRVDGERGELLLAGYPVEEIAPRVRFEEMAYLLVNGELPDADPLDELHRALAARRALGAPTRALVEAAAERGAAPMDTLIMGCASLGLEADAQSKDREIAGFDARSLRLLAAFPTLVAAAWCRSQGRELPPLREDLGHSAHFLYLLRGEEPSEDQVRALDTYLCTVSDHGANASTFTARVIVSTRSDVVSAVTGALGALKGPLHGGAPGPALDMVFEIGKPERAEEHLRARLAAGERLMGFGHRVYKVRDPRASVLAAAGEKLYERSGDRSLYELARHVEEVAVRLLAEHKPGRRLDTNVEFYTALLLHGLDFETSLFTPVFAMGRIAGWLAHCREQLATGRLIRPRLVYTGPEGLTLGSPRQPAVTGA